ncbi:hypothetical protein PMAYCL1PPCAC_32125 [Pristionchus mayeri]|uniref:G protein-coupled receptor n=1 Tax=Pristionchus mayeri TaxID=1317129 RepID=A0AAN5DGY2_9BILA|nr:hypothetical protein PMAYCL1PPCAC_32125 [Pristionchus mayeri]
MNSTELSAHFHSVIAFAHHIGLIFFVFNLLVCVLVIVNTDSRGLAYRKYLFSLQLSSTLTDFITNAYSPFMLFNCRVFYSQVAFAKLFTFQSVMNIYFTCFFSVIFTYFCCVYYRRNLMLPRDAFFCFHGSAYIIFLASAQLFILGILCIVFYVVSSLPAPIEVSFVLFLLRNVQNVRKYLHWLIG